VYHSVFESDGALGASEDAGQGAQQGAGLYTSLLMSAFNVQEPGIDLGNAASAPALEPAAMQPSNTSGRELAGNKRSADVRVTPLKLSVCPDDDKKLQRTQQ
jgi:hypothetical protein